MLAHDPLVKEWPELQIPVLSDLPPARAVDAVVLAVAHPEYRRLDFHGWLKGGRPAVLDANAVLTERQRQAVLSAGCVFAGIGEG